MATSNQLPYTDLTVCTICFETFKCPKTLPCLHNFCKACIESYLASLFEKGHGDINCVTCPICRAEVKKPQNVSNSEEWTNNLPTNHLLVSMVDSVTGLQNENICSSCDMENKTESAVFWCAECRKALCELCERKHSYFIQGHKVVNMKEIHDLDPKAISANVRCSKHREKTIEAFCFDHNVPCCSSCVMINHRKCDKVEEANSAATELRNSTLIFQLQEDLKMYIQKMNELLYVTAKNVKTFKEKVDYIQNEIRRLRSEINNHMDRIETKVREELASLEKEHLPEIECTVQTMSGERKRAENDLRLLKASVEYASDEQLLCDIEKLTNDRNKIEECWEENKMKIKEKRLLFYPNEGLQKLLDIHTFGKVSLTEEKIHLESDPVDLLEAVPVKVSEFVGNSNCTNITGCVMVDEKRLLIATCSLQCIEMYEINGTLLSSLSLGGWVWGVDMIDENNGAATLWTERKVVLFTNEDNNMNITKSVICSDSGYIGGIKCHNGRLYVGATDKVIVLDKSGSLIENIDQPGQSWIRHLSVWDEKLVYTNSKVVQCITVRGENVFTFSSPKLLLPEGISVDTDSNVYTIGQSSRNIFQLTPEGKFHRILLENRAGGCINSLFFCQQTNKLIFNTGNVVHIYEMRNKPSQEH